MEGAEPGHAFHAFADEAGNALFHFPRRLVGEGDGKNLRRSGKSGRQNMRDTRRKDPGLAGAGTRKNKDRPFRCLDGEPLFRIQTGKVVRCPACRHGTRGDPALRTRRCGRHVPLCSDRLKRVVEGIVIPTRVCHGFLVQFRKKRSRTTCQSSDEIRPVLLLKPLWASFGILKIHKMLTREQYSNKAALARWEIINRWGQEKQGISGV